MDRKPTTLTHALRNGELEHVVIVQGEQVQTHSSRAAAMCALMLALACAGCATCERHPVVCATVAASIALSVPSLVHTSNRGTTGVDGHDVTVPTVNCNGGASCQ